MDILEKLSERWSGREYPFLIHSSGSFRFNEVANQQRVDLSEVKIGELLPILNNSFPISLSEFIKKSMDLIIPSIASSIKVISLAIEPLL